MGSWNARSKKKLRGQLKDGLDLKNSKIKPSNGFRHDQYVHGHWLVILTAFQLAMSCYLFLMGPIAAATLCLAGQC